MVVAGGIGSGGGGGVGSSSLAATFADRLAQTPHAPAIAEGDGGAPWSYAEVAHAVHALAAVLSKHTSPGDGVGVLVDEGVSLVICELAVLHCGCWFCPMEPQVPLRRYTSVAAAINLTAAVAFPPRADLPHATVNTDTWTRRTPVDADAGSTAVAAAFATTARPHTTDRCYVQHTSGTTGTPKAIACTHAQVMGYARNRCAIEGIGRRSRVLMCSSSTFDPSQGDLATWLVSGCVLVAPPRPVLFHSFAEVIRCGAVTHLLAAPAVFSLVEDPPDTFAQLEVVALGGEPMPPSIVAAWTPHPRIRLYNVYGVTEATVYQTYKLMTPETPVRVIGRGYPGVELCIRHPHKATDIAPGEEGEGILVMEGPGVMRGYVNDGGGCDGECAATPPRYATGDRCRWVRADAEGDGGAGASHEWDIYIIGRADDQIKLHGVRMEPGEIEAAIGASRLAARSCVVADRGQLVAHVALAGGVAPNDLAEFALAERCRRSLPMSLRPRKFVLRTMPFPLTANGKVDRAALLCATTDISTAPTGGVGDVDTIVPLSTPLEVLLAGVWESVLGAADVHAASDWHRLGGSSLQAILAVRKLRAVVVGGGGGAGWASAGAGADPSQQQQQPPKQRVATEASGDAALFLHSASLVANEHGEVFGGDAECFMGMCDGGTYAPCKLMEHSTLRDYAAFLAENGVRVPGEVPATRGAEPQQQPQQSPIEDARTELVKKAARSGALPILQDLQDAGYPLAPKDGARAARGVTLLHLAAGEGHAATVAFLLAAGLPATAATGRMAVPAHFAAAAGHAGALAALLPATPIRIRDKGKQTLLHYAVRSGQMDVLELLVGREGVEMDAMDAQFRTPLHWATFHRHVDVVRELVRRGVRVEFPPIQAGIVARRTRLPAHPPADLALQVFTSTTAGEEQAAAVAMLDILLAAGACTGKARETTVAQRRADADALAAAGYEECAARLRAAVEQSTQRPKGKGKGSGKDNGTANPHTNGNDTQHVDPNAPATPAAAAS